MGDKRKPLKKKKDAGKVPESAAAPVEVKAVPAARPKK